MLSILRLRIFLLATLLLVAFGSVQLSSARPASPSTNLTSEDSSLEDIAEPRALFSRDAYTDLRQVDSDDPIDLKPEKTPKGAYARDVPIPGSNANIFTWWSKEPKDEKSAQSAFVIIHGRLRNANTYYSTLSKIYKSAMKKNLESASANAILVSPRFMSTVRNKGAYKDSELAWGDVNAWAAGEASTHPPGVAISTFTVLDSLLNEFADQSKYPNMKYVTFIAHGGGAQLIQRWAVLGKDNPAPGRIQLRYVVGDPSSCLYFTRDRPVEVNEQSCPSFNDFRYGLSNYDAPYSLPSGGDPAGMFKRYASRDVRYVIGLDDDSTKNGDQLCMARAAGGAQRKNRSLAYWKYINLLGGANPSDYSTFPGSFPMLDPSANNTKVPTSAPGMVQSFRGTQIAHHLATVQGVGHNAPKVLNSNEGLVAVFGDANSANQGPRPNLGTALAAIAAAGGGQRRKTAPSNLHSS